jgi:D-alanine-D-alanine ligase
MNKTRVAIFFGGRSPEHEVSVVTALQAYESLDKEKYEVTAVYVSKSGQFYTNPKFLEIKNYVDIDSLLLSSAQVTFFQKNGQGGLLEPKTFPKFHPIEVAFPIFHGAFGEDGCIQGVFESFQIPYVGFNVMASAVAMDKVVSKAVFKSLGLSIGAYFVISRLDWNEDPKNCLNQIKKELKFPLFIKPADTGSTIGIGKAKNDDDLNFCIEVAATYSDKILIEESFEGCIEINCAALGYKKVVPSVCEMPISSGDVLTFEDKYMRGSKGSKSGGNKAGMASLTRKIPAPISKKLTKEIQDATVKVFKGLEGCGVARIDYFVDPKSEKFWINELNSPPGSLAFYLYESIGISYKELLDQLIASAKERFEDQKKTQFTFNTPLLSQMAIAAQEKTGN